MKPVPRIVQALIWLYLTLVQWWRKRHGGAPP